jgi:hypothetical protein
MKVLLCWSFAVYKGLTFVLILLGLAVLSASHQRYPSRNQEGPTQPPAVSPFASNQPQPQKETAESHNKMEWLYVLISWPEGITTLSVILTLGAIVWQSSETRSAAQIALRAANIMDETAKRQLRAYMCFRQGRVFVDDKNSARAAIELENTGQTPAHALCGFTTFGFGPEPKRVDPATVPGKRSVAVIGAGKSFTTSIPIPNWNANTVKAISDGKFMLFGVGEYRYKDIFDGPERTIRFQVGLGGRFGQPVADNKEGRDFYQLFTDAEGNDAT